MKLGKFSERSWIQRTAKQSKLEVEWEEVHWLVKLKRADEHWFANKSARHEVETSRRESCDEQWNVDNAKTVSSRTWESKK